MREPWVSKDSSPGSPRYDESDWPIFRVTMPRVPLSEAAFGDHLDACSRRYKLGRPFCMLIDMGEQPPLGAVRRKAVADRMLEDSQRLPGVMLGCALVVRTPIARGGVTAINWIAKPAYSFTAFGNMQEAHESLVHILAQHGLVVPQMAGRSGA